MTDCSPVSKNKEAPARLAVRREDYSFGRLFIPVLHDEKLSMGAKMLHAYLWSRHYSSRSSIFPSQDTIAFDMRCSRSTIIRWVQEVQERGLITVEKRGSCHGPQLVYVLEDLQSVYGEAAFLGWHDIDRSRRERAVTERNCTSVSNCDSSDVSSRNCTSVSNCDSSTVSNCDSSTVSNCDTNKTNDEEEKKEKEKENTSNAPSEPFAGISFPGRDPFNPEFAPIGEKNQEEKIQETSPIEASQEEKKSAPAFSAMSAFSSAGRGVAELRADAFGVSKEQKRLAAESRKRAKEEQKAEAYKSRMAETSERTKKPEWQLIYLWGQLAEKRGMIKNLPTNAGKVMKDFLGLMDNDMDKAKRVMTYVFENWESIKAKRKWTGGLEVFLFKGLSITGIADEALCGRGVDGEKKSSVVFKQFLEF